MGTLSNPCPTPLTNNISSNTTLNPLQSHAHTHTYRYHGVLSNYSRGFDAHTLEHLDAATRVNDVEDNFREGDLNKSTNDSLAHALDGVWRTLGSGKWMGGQGGVHASGWI